MNKELNYKMESTNYVTRSSPKDIEVLENFSKTILNNYITYTPSDEKIIIFLEFKKYIDDVENTHQKDKKIQKIRILWNNLVYVEKFHFLFKNINFRKSIIDRIKYFSEYDREFYMYIPYIYNIFDSVKQNKYIK